MHAGRDGELRFGIGLSQSAQRYRASGWDEQRIGASSTEAGSPKLGRYSSRHDVMCRRPFAQYPDDVLPGFADKRFRTAIRHGVGKFLYGLNGVVSAMRPQITLVSHANSAPREVFVRGQRR